MLFKENFLTYSSQMVDELEKKFKDPRKKRGIRFPFRFLLHIILFVFAFGNNNISSIKDLKYSLNVTKSLRLLYGKKIFLPTVGCVRYLLTLMDSEALFYATHEIVLKWTKKFKLEGEFNGIAIAIDGKTLRGAHAFGDHPPSCLNAVLHGSGMTLAQKPFDSRQTNEIYYLREMVSSLNIKGTLITADAIHTQGATARLIAEKDAFYLFTVKGNQSGLRSLIANSIHDSDAGCDFYAEAPEKAHGRIETRSILVKNSPLCIQKIFPYAQQIFLIKREVFHISRNKTTVEYCYGITNLQKKHANAKELLGFNRGHWAVENKLHHCLDVTMREDSTRCRTGQLPFVISAFKKLVLNILRMCGATNIAQAQRQLAFSF